jgi:hypothetical protein
MNREGHYFESTIPSRQLLRKKEATQRECSNLDQMIPQHNLRTSVSLNPTSKSKLWSSTKEEKVLSTDLELFCAFFFSSMLVNK